MKKKQDKSDAKRIVIPLLMSLPLILAVIVVMLKFGDTIRDLISVAIKMAVVS